MTDPFGDPRDEETANRVAILLREALADPRYDAGPYARRAVTATRTRRRRARAAVLALTAVAAAGLITFAISPHHGTGQADGLTVATPPATPPSATMTAAATGPTALPAAGQVVRTIPFPPSETELFAADGSDLDVAIVSGGGQPDSITVERVSGTTGAVSATRVPFPLASYLSNIAVGSDGIYLGTSVVRRFSSAPDVLVRLDPTTRTITAQASFPAQVQAFAAGTQLWATLGDGTVVRLDPRTLTVERSTRIPARQQTTTVVTGPPVLGLGNLWVLAGDETDLRLIRMDPNTLAILSTTPVPTGGALYQSLNALTANTQHLYLAGRDVVPVDASGALGGVVQPSGWLSAVAVRGSGLVAIAAEPPSLVLLDSDGRTTARTPLDDVSGLLAVSGDTAWLLGNAGQGDGIVQLHLTPSPPAG